MAGETGSRAIAIIRREHNKSTWDVHVRLDGDESPQELNRLLANRRNTYPTAEFALLWGDNFIVFVDPDFERVM